MPSPTRPRNPFRLAVGRSALIIVAAVTAAAVANAAPAVAQTPGSLLLNEGFDAPLWPNGLITNEYAYFNPGDPARAVSPTWEMTSGSLFSRAWKGWTGAPHACDPVDRYSQTCTNSAIFRLHTKRSDFRNVKVIMKLRLNSFTSTAQTPPQAWDGVHIFLRYQSQFHLYYASVGRRDGDVVIKKKCPGGPSNGGTYYTLGPELAGYPVPIGSETKVAASVRTLADGSVRLRLYRNGAWIVDVIDTGVGCAPITAPGSVGIRTDNADAEFEDYSVEAI